MGYASLLEAIESRSSVFRKWFIDRSQRTTASRKELSDHVARNWSPAGAREV
jgi:hypothetical protein